MAQVVFAVKDKKFRPEKQTPSSAGYDLSIYESKQILPGETIHVRTGVTIAILNKYWGLLETRSSFEGNTGLVIRSGVIDSDFRGEILLRINNPTSETVHIRKGTRAAQLIFIALDSTKVKYYDSLPHELLKTERGVGGFGSTGGYDTM